MRLLFLILAASAAHPAPTEWKLSGDGLDIHLSAAARGALASVVDRASGREFIVSPKPSTLFRITVTAEDGKTRDLTAADAASFEATPSGEELVLRYRNLGGQELHAECRVRLKAGDTLSRWNIALENRSRWSIRSVLYPVVLAPSQLGPEWADDRVLSPAHTNGGELRISQGAPNPFPGAGRTAYPGPAQAQFVAYYDSTAGLYVATYDGAGHHKKVGFSSSRAGVDLSAMHEVWGAPATGWKMPYDTVLGVFRGDWHAAADIYKSWAVNQPWCSRKLTQRTDIPRWLREGRPLVMFIPRGGEYYSTELPPRTPDRYLTRPPLPEPGLRPRAPALFADVAHTLRSPLIVIEYGWEKHGAWISPDVFPPYGGDDAFRRQAAALRRNGHIMCAFLSGTRWGVAKTGRKEYDGWPAFKRDGLAGAATGPDQQPGLIHAPWASNARLCIGSPVTQRLLLDIVRGLVERGVSFVQYDQNHGGEAYECHNRAHSHAPGGGLWMGEETRRFMAAARKMGKALDPDFALTIEDPCEFFIQDVDAINDRPYIIQPANAETVPVFNYLYHEYQLSFGGDTPLGVHCPEADLIRIARSFTAGMLVEGPSFGTSREWPKDELEFLATIVHAQRTFAHPYAIEGRMLPPPPMDNVPMIDAGLVGGTREIPVLVKPVQVAAVMVSAWQSPSGKVGYLLANASAREARPTLRVSGGEWVKVWEGGRQKLMVRDGRLEAPIGPRGIAVVEQE